MRFQVKDTSAAFLALMQKRADQMPFASAVAITRTAFKIKTAETDLMVQKLDRPTRWTLNSVEVKPATKTKLEAIVRTKTPSGKSVPVGRYLSPLVEGGQRRDKATENILDSYWTPARGVQLDGYGNIALALIRKILRQPNLAASKARAAHTLAKKKGRGKKEAYFINNGILFQREGKAKPSALLILVNKVPTYRKLLPWHETAQKTFDANMPTEFYKALDEFKD